LKDCQINLDNAFRVVFMNMWDVRCGMADVGWRMCDEKFPLKKPETILESGFIVFGEEISLSGP